MVKAYVLIEMVAGHSKNLVDSLRGRQGLQTIDRVTGPYDIVVTVEAEDLNGISALVNGDIHVQPGVARTTTCVSLE